MRDQTNTPTATTARSTANVQLPKLNTSATDSRIALKIARRAIEEYPELGDLVTLIMDIEYAHMGTPMELETLLVADEFNFAHDIFGIRRHINRRNGKLENCFVPRFAARQTINH